MKPLATSLALYLSMEPSNLYLTLYTHLQPIGFLPGGNYKSIFSYGIRAVTNLTNLYTCEQGLIDLTDNYTWATKLTLVIYKTTSSSQYNSN